MLRSAQFDRYFLSAPHFNNKSIHRIWFSMSMNVGRDTCSVTASFGRPIGLSTAVVDWRWHEFISRHPLPYVLFPNALLPSAHAICWDTAWFSHLLPVSQLCCTLLRVDATRNCYNTSAHMHLFKCIDIHWCWVAFSLTLGASMRPSFHHSLMHILWLLCLAGS